MRFMSQFPHLRFVNVQSDRSEIFFEVCDASALRVCFPASCLVPPSCIDHWTEPFGNALAESVDPAKHLVPG